MDAERPSQRKQWKFALPLVLVLITAAAYSSSLPNGFTNWDDNWLVTQNPWIKEATLANVTTILDPATPARIRVQLGGEYLPVRDLSYMLDHLLFGDSAPGYHAVNLLLHALVVLLVFAALRGAGGGRFFSFAAAALFAVNPVHVESVAWISSRKDLLAGLFCMLAVLAWMRFLKEKRPSGRAVFHFAATFAFAAAVTSKYMAVTLPAWLILYSWLFGSASRPIVMRRAAFILAKGARPFAPAYAFLARDSVPRRILAPLAAAAPLLAFDFLFIKNVVVVIASRGLIRDYYGGSFAATLLTSVKVFAEYVLLLFFPQRLMACIDYPITHAPDAAAAASAVLLAVLAAAALFWTWKALRRPGPGFGAAKTAAFAAAFFFITLSPVSNVVFPMGTLMAERYLYMAVLSSSLAAAVALEWIRARGGPALVPAAALLLMLAAFGMKTFERCRVWKDSGTLWTDTLNQAGGSHHTAHFNLGNFHLEEAARLGKFTGKKRLDPALEQLKAALVTTHESYNYDYSRVHAAMGTVLSLMDRREEAIAHFDKALEMNQEAIDSARNDNIREGEIAARADIYLNKGETLSKEEDPRPAALAKTCFEKAIDLNPGLAPAYLNLGLIIYRNTGDDGARQDARRLIMRAAELDKYLDEAPLNLGIIAFNEGRSSEALSWFDRVLARNPNHLDARFYRGAVFLGDKKFDAARAEFASIRDRPGAPVEWVANAAAKIGVAYEMEEKYVEAERIYIDVISRTPAEFAEAAAGARRSLYSLYLLFGNAMFAKGGFEKAKELLSKAVAADPSGTDARNGASKASMEIGAALLQKASDLRDAGRLDEAREGYRAAEAEFRDSIRFKPTFDAWFAIAECEKKQGNVDGAAGALEKALELSPKSALVQDELMKFYIHKGEESRQAGKEDEAEKLFLRAHRVNPAGVDPLRILVSIYENSASAAQAKRKEYESAGHAEEAKEQERAASAFLEKALDMYGRILALRPSSAADLSSKARILSLLGKIEDAAAVFARLAELYPADGNHWYNLGLLLIRLGRESDALEALEKGHAAAPDHSRLSEALASTLLRQGLLLNAAFTTMRKKLSSAIPEAEKAQARSRAVETASRAAALLRRHGEIDPANAVKSAAFLGKLEGFLFLDRAREIIAQGGSGAADALTKALEADPALAEAAVAAADLLEKAGDRDEREKTVELLSRPAVAGHLDETRQDRVLKARVAAGRARYEYGLSDLREGKAESAARQLDRAIALWPEFPYSHYHRAVAMERLGHKDKALEGYKACSEILKRHMEGMEGEGRILAEDTLRSCAEAIAKLGG